MFSAELPWCYLCAETNVLGMTRNFTEQLFGKYKKYLQKMKARGPTTCPRGWGRACPPRACPYLVGSLLRLRLQLHLHILSFDEKKIREKKSSRFTIWSRRQALKPLGWPNLDSVQGSEVGNPSPSSSSTILHHQFHDAHHRA